MSNPLINAKKEYFDLGDTKSYAFRIEQLRILKETIKRYESDILEALLLDLGKPSFESYTAEVGIVYQEIDTAIKNLKKWMHPKRVPTPIYLQPGKSFVYPEPKGVVLIISPWNYPFQLAMSPLVGAIAAGNCVLLKPSNKTKETETIIAILIFKAFLKNYVSVVRGPGSEVVPSLIENHRFDHIFFTGSVDVGRTILKHASKYPTPVTLELGGKSPVIVHEDCDVDLAAKRITWAKFYNCGQTCVAPDYMLVHESKKEVLVEKTKHYIKEYYGDPPIDSPNYGRIINRQRFHKLVSHLEGCKIIQGGSYEEEERFISPTLVEGLSMDHSLMKEEIFGPILPILTYKEITEVTDIVKMNPYPLSLYLFTKDTTVENYILENIQFGGGCINHLITHVANHNLPFGGVGYSGMGNYHSKYTFDTFSHQKSIFKSKGKLDTNLLYPPYKKERLKLVKKFIK